MYDLTKFEVLRQWTVDTPDPSRREDRAGLVVVEKDRGMSSVISRQLSCRTGPVELQL